MIEECEHITETRDGYQPKLKSKVTITWCTKEGCNYVKTVKK